MAETPLAIYQAQLTGTDALIYTAPTTPTGVVVILRGIRCTNNTTVQDYLYLSVGADTAANRIFNKEPIPAQGQGSLDWTGFLALAAGSTLRAHAQTTTTLTLSIHGVVWSP